LQRNLTNDLNKIAPGRAQYTHLLNERGGVEDDIIVWWLDDDLFHVMPNASNTVRVISALGGRDITDERALIAVQGPEAKNFLRDIVPAASSLGRFRTIQDFWEGEPLVIAGTGYTGQDGVEIAVPVTVAVSLWRRIMHSGIQPAGLGARDTLRLEAGLPLHGHELGPDISPLQADLGWVVAWDKGDFLGREALVTERAAGVRHILRGITTQGRRPPREGATVSIINDQGESIDVGVVSSGNFSPSLGYGVALAFLDPAIALGQRVTVTVRDSALEGLVTTTRFLE
jgi:aminomethyltransferase